MALTLAAAALLATWIGLAAARGGFWRGRERLRRASPEPAEWPAVAAIIPARNEAAAIGATMAAHAGADYPGPLRVILVDDASEDGTAEAARTGWASSARDKRALDIVAAPPLAAGWTGKLNAMAKGVSVSQSGAPAPRYLLLADADIAFAPSTLKRLVAKAEAEGLALTSLMARLDSRGTFAALLIPPFVYFFQLLYPFPWANDPSRRIAAAAGGCMLVRADALAAAGGLAAIRDRLIDDCALAALIKSAGGRIWIGLARDEAVSLRDNRALHSIWSMVARTAFVQLDRSWAKLAGAVAGVLAGFLGPAAIAILAPAHGNLLAASLAAAAWGVMAMTFAPTARLYAQPAWRGFLLPAAAALYAAMTLSSGLDHLLGRGGLWKGRTYR